MEENGRARGGKARAEKLPAEERTRIAREAAHARWADEKVAVCGSPDRPLHIGEFEFPCYVLEDGTRVLTQGGMLAALGRHPKANVRPEELEEGGERLPALVQGKAIRPYISADLLEQSQPITFRTPQGRRASGYRAELLPHLCEVYLRARDAGVLPKNQEHVARQADILVRGLAHVGIIALVDEATGYQAIRARDALATILEEFIAKELQPWLKTFPPDFYKELFRLRGFEFPRDMNQRPRYFGQLTNDIVYERLAPGVLEELKRVTPRNDSGRRKHKYFQRLTSEIGYPKLREHLGSVVTIMKLSSNWEDFQEKLDMIHPKFGTTRRLPFLFEETAAD